MKLIQKSVIDSILLLILIALFLIILPGLAAAGGSVLLTYINVLEGLPLLASRLAFAAVTMIVISLNTATKLKSDRKFLKTPVLLTLAGIIMIPLEYGLAGALSSAISTESSTSLLIMFTDEIAQSMLKITPILLLSIAVFCLGGELVALTWRKILSNRTMH
ncbi:TPA: hypothetical protein ME351_005607 [Klebsiella pneumoniae]|nr:hypothetical protein [Klebsiella pneumoniae]